MGFVYVLQSLRNGRYYIGSTVNLESRINSHVSGRSKYTSEILPVRLVFSQKYNDLKTARRVELWLKKQKDRQPIEKIILQRRINKQFG